MGRRPVFRTTSAHQDKVAGMEIGRDAAARDRRSRYVTAKWFGGEFAYNHPVEFQLYLGDKKFPRTKTMTVVERKIENSRFEDKFYKSLDNNGETNRKLSMWKFVDYKKYESERQEYIQYRAAGGENRWPKQDEEEK